MDEFHMARQSRLLRRLGLVSGWVVFLLWSVAIGEKDHGMRHALTMVAISVTSLIALMWLYRIIRDCRTTFRGIAKYGS